MTTPKEQTWIYVSIGNLGNFSNRVVVDDSTYTDYRPLLLSITGVGSAMDNYTPQSGSGTVTIDNRPGTYGYERRLSDLLISVSPIGQLVKVYAANSKLGLFDPTADWVQVFQSVCSSWTIANDTVQFSFATDPIPRRTVTKLIDLTNFPSAIAGSLGKSLPIIFGSDVQTPAVLVAAAADTSPEFAFATTLADDYVVGTPTSYQLKLDAPFNTTYGDYGRVVSASGINTATDSDNSAVNATPPAYYNLYRAQAQRVVVTSNERLWTHVLMRFKGKSSGGWTGNSTGRISIWWAPNQIMPQQEIAYGEFDKSDYQTSFRGAADFDIEVSLNKPVWTGSGYYFLAFSQTVDESQNAGAGDAVDPGGITGAGQTVYYQLDGALATGLHMKPGWRKYTGQSNKQFYYSIYSLVITPTTAPGSTYWNNDGLGHAFFELTQHAAVSGQSNYDLTLTNWIVYANGLQDDAGGTITGSANQRITSPQHAIEVLDKEWSGSAWTGGKLSGTKYSSTWGQVNTTTSRYYRKLKGQTSGRTTLLQAYEQICRNGACRIAINNNTSTTPLGVYVWGTNQTTAAVITDEDAKVTQIRQVGTETIVNNIQIYYDKRFTRNNPIFFSSEGNTIGDFAGAFEMYSGKDLRSNNLVNTSYGLYGSRILRNPTFEMIGDSSSADIMAEFLATTYAKPHVLVTLEMPYFKYSAIDMLDVIEILHPDLPSYYGTSANAELPTYGGARVEITQGQYWKRAERYRAQVEAREIQFSTSELLTLKITARLLLNFPNDPT